MNLAAWVLLLATLQLALARSPQVPLARPRSGGPVLLLLPGYDYPEWAPTPSVRGWYGLFTANGSYDLRAVRITFAPVNSCGELDTRARRVAVPGAAQPVFIVRSHGPNLPPWQAGAVAPAVGQTWLHPGDRRDIRTGAGAYRLAAAGTDAAGNVYDYVLRLIDLRSGHSQLIFSYAPPVAVPREPRPMPSLLWMGDLDRDGRPDLVLEDSMSEIEAHYVLYLSSAARVQELVHPVANFHRGSC
jgi:hypothetical protein